MAGGIVQTTPFSSSCRDPSSGSGILLNSSAVTSFSRTASIPPPLPRLHGMFGQTASEESESINRREQVGDVASEARQNIVAVKDLAVIQNLRLSCTAIHMD